MPVYWNLTEKVIIPAMNHAMNNPEEKQHFRIKPGFFGSSRKIVLEGNFKGSTTFSKVISLISKMTDDLNEDNKVFGASKSYMKAQSCEEETKTISKKKIELLNAVNFLKELDSQEQGFLCKLFPSIFKSRSEEINKLKKQLESISIPEMNKENLNT